MKNEDGEAHKVFPAKRIKSSSWEDAIIRCLAFDGGPVEGGSLTTSKRMAPQVLKHEVRNYGGTGDSPPVALILEHRSDVRADMRMDKPDPQPKA